MKIGTDTSAIDTPKLGSQLFNCAIENCPQKKNRQPNNFNGACSSIVSLQHANQKGTMWSSATAIFHPCARLAIFTPDPTWTSLRGLRPVA
jgi:hypothetical protein